MVLGDVYHASFTVLADLRESELDIKLTIFLGAALEQDVRRVGKSGTTFTFDDRVADFGIWKYLDEASHQSGVVKPLRG